MLAVNDYRIDTLDESLISPVLVHDLPNYNKPAGEGHPEIW